MLVLTRRPGESVAIGDGIRVHILRASGSRVRIGIEAPADLRIVRLDVPAEPTAAADPPPAETPAADPMPQDGSPVDSPRPRFRTGVPISRRGAGADRHVSLE